jgi:hypothetical protein
VTVTTESSTVEPLTVRTAPMSWPATGSRGVSSTTSSPLLAASSPPTDSCRGPRVRPEANQEATAATTHATVANQKAAVSPSANGPEINCGKKLRPVRNPAWSAGSPARMGPSSC